MFDDTVQDTLVQNSKVDYEEFVLNQCKDSDLQEKERQEYLQHANRAYYVR